MKAKTDKRIAFGVYDPRVKRFVREIGPLVVRDYRQYNQPICVISLGNGGVNFGLGLYGYLRCGRYPGSNVDVEYGELRDPERSDLPAQANRRIALFVDDGINTGTVYDNIMRHVPKFKERNSILDVKFAVPVDNRGVATYVCDTGYDTLDVLMRPFDVAADFIKYLRFPWSDKRDRTVLSIAPEPVYDPKNIRSHPDVGTTPCETLASEGLTITALATLLANIKK